MSFSNDSDTRYGSAAFCDESDIRKAGMFKQKPHSLLVGFTGKRALWYSGAGGLILIAGARGGKLRDILAYNICAGIHAPSMLILDMKGELAAIGQDQTPDNKHCIYWNPCGLHGLPQHRINPLAYVRIDSHSLVSDVKMLCQNLVSTSARNGADYFEGRAREFLEAIILTLVRMHGELNFKILYDAVNLIPGGADKWLNFAFEMHESGFQISSRIEEEIANARADMSSGGYQGILGELFKALSCLSDPTLMVAVSPPYSFSMEQMCDPDQAAQVYFMPPAEFVESWAPVIKSLFVAGMIYKARAPHAPRQTWILDECAQLGGFPLVEKMFTYGAGIGIRPWAVFQSVFQMERLGKNSANIITSSAQLRSYFAVRDIDTATLVSRMLGEETLEYDDEIMQARARHAKHQAMQTMMSGGDLMMAGMNYAHHRQETEIKSKQQRSLRTADEVLNTPADRQYIFSDGLPGPIYAERRAYYEQAFMAGRYHPNPYHPPETCVSVKTRWGHTRRPVVTAPVPSRFSSYPQYAGGMWSKIGR